MARKAKATQQDTTVRNLRAGKGREDALRRRVQVLEAAQRQTNKLLRMLTKDMRAIVKAL